MANQQTTEFLFKAVADTAGLDKFAGGVKALAGAVGAADDVLAQFGRQVVEAGQNLKFSENALGAQSNLLKQLRADATIASTAYRQLGIQANSLARLQKLAQAGLAGPDSGPAKAREIAMENTAEALKDYRTELEIAIASGDKSRNSLERQAAAWRKIRNEVDPASKAFRESTIELTRLERQLERTDRRQFGGGNRFAPGQTAGVLAGASIYGGPLGFLGGAAGAVLGGGPAGALIGAQIGAQAGMTTQSLGNMADYAAQIDKLKIGLKEVTANQWEYNRALEVAAMTTKNFNVPQEIAIKNVTQLSAAVLGSGGNLRDVEDVYIGVSSAVKALGGSAEQVDGALLAMIQTFSKGRVSAEELNQIAERLPGAFIKFQQATGKGIKDLERGTVGLKDTMKFVRLLREEYEEAAKKIGASQQDAGARLQVQINDLRETVGRELGPIGADFQKALADAIPAAKELLLAMKPVAQLLADVAKLAIGFAASIARMPSAFKDALLSALPFAGQMRDLARLKKFILGEKDQAKDVAQGKVPGSDRQSNLPDPKPGDADNKAAEAAAKRQRDLAYQLYDLREELNKRLYENEIDYAERAAEFNKQTIEDAARLRRDIEERARRYMRDQGDELTGFQRRLEDAQAEARLQERVAAIRERGSNLDKAILDEEIDAARTEFDLAQRNRQRDREESDRRRDQTRKLEEFKQETAKLIGEMEDKYAKGRAKLQEDYARNSAKILQAGAENAAKAIEAAARAAAQDLSNINIGGGSSAAGTGSTPGAMTPLLKKFSDILFGAESANDRAGNGYNSFNLGGRNGGRTALGSGVNPNLSQNTVQSIMERQSRVGGLHAVGRYQIIGSTMKGLMSGAYGETGVKPSDRFDAATQDKFFQALLMKRIKPYLEGRATIDDAVKQLRFEWVGLEEVGTETIRGWLKEFKAAGGATGSPSGPIGLTGGTPGSPNAGLSSGAHLDARWTNGGPITAADIDRFVRVAGKAPSSYGVSSGYGPRNAPVPGASTFHKGIDFRTPANLPITLTGGARFAGSKPASASGGGGLVGVIDTPMGQMQLLHLEKILMKPGAAQAPVGAPAPRATYKPAPLPPPLNPNDYKVDFSKQEAQIKANALRNEEAAAAVKLAEAQNDLNRLRDEGMARMLEIVQLGKQEAKLGQQRYDNDVKRLELMRDGISPDLAEQFISIDNAAAAASEELARMRDLALVLSQSKDLSEEQRAIQAELVAFADKQLQAQSGITAQLRNQAVQSQQLKQDPTTIVQERLSTLQGDQGQLVNLGNQAVFVANTIGDAFGQAFEGVVTGSQTAQEALANMFKSIAASFAKMAADIFANQLQMAILRLIGGALGGGLGGGMGGGIGAFGNPGILGLGGGALGFAKGGAFAANGIVPFAKGGIVDSPTLFKFAKGGSFKTGVAGEAGPEAILPLSRGAGGKLGVKMEVPKRSGSRMKDAEPAAPEKPIKVKVETQMINGVEYVTRDQFESGLRGAVGQAQQATAKSMRTSLRYRRSAGLG